MSQNATVIPTMSQNATVMPTMSQNEGNHELIPYILGLLIVLILFVVLATLAKFVYIRKYHLVKLGSKDIIKRLKTSHTWNTSPHVLSEFISSGM